MPRRKSLVLAALALEVSIGFEAPLSLTPRAVAQAGSRLAQAAAPITVAAVLFAGNPEAAFAGDLEAGQGVFEGACSSPSAKNCHSQPWTASAPSQPPHVDTEFHFPFVLGRQL